jgi:dephospho-CoA kinase
VIGLIGGIGAGKSQVAEELAAHGAFVIDADKVGHALLDQHPTRDQVISRFGDQIRDPSDPSRIDRKALGGIVFQNPEARRTLEEVLHPRMRRTFEKAIARVLRQGTAQAVILDAAILLEAGWDDLCDLILFVDVSRELRLARVASSRGWTDADLASRERSQWPLNRKRDRADVILTNEVDIETLRTEVRRFWRRLMARIHRRRPGQLTRTPAPDPSPPPPNSEVPSP